MDLNSGQRQPSTHNRLDFEHVAFGSRILTPNLVASSSCCVEVAVPPSLALIKSEYDEGVVEVPCYAVKPKEVLLKVFRLFQTV